MRHQLGPHSPKRDKSWTSISRRSISRCGQAPSGDTSQGCVGYFFFGGGGGGFPVSTVFDRPGSGCRPPVTRFFGGGTSLGTPVILLRGGRSPVATSASPTSFRSSVAVAEVVAVFRLPSDVTAAAMAYAAESRLNRNGAPESRLARDRGRMLRPSEAPSSLQLFAYYFSLSSGVSLN
jgi:hypothetical protein